MFKVVRLMPTEGRVVAAWGCGSGAGVGQRDGVSVCERKSSRDLFHNNLSILLTLLNYVVNNGEDAEFCLIFLSHF